LGFAEEFSFSGMQRLIRAGLAVNGEKGCSREMAGMGEALANVAGFLKDASIRNEMVPAGLFRHERVLIVSATSSNAFRLLARQMLATAQLSGSLNQQTLPEKAAGMI
jgi:hypothetical protein